MLTLIFALAAIVPAFAVGQAGAADDLPAFDIVQNCKGESSGAGTGVESCTRDETNAKDELAKRWSSYAASAKKDLHRREQHRRRPELRRALDLP
jgi:hypothetical protein